LCFSFKTRIVFHDFLVFLEKNQCTGKLGLHSHLAIAGRHKEAWLAVMGT
jgi:hypothetical protein